MSCLMADRPCLSQQLQFFHYRLIPLGVKGFWPSGAPRGSNILSGQQPLNYNATPWSSSHPEALLMVSLSPVCVSLVHPLFSNQNLIMQVTADKALDKPASGRTRSGKEGLEVKVEWHQGPDEHLTLPKSAFGPNGQRSLPKTIPGQPSLTPAPDPSDSME